MLVEKGVMVGDDPWQVLIQDDDIRKKGIAQVLNIPVVIVNLIPDGIEQLPGVREQDPDVSIFRIIQGLPEFTEEGDIQLLFGTLHQKFGKPVGNAGHIHSADGVSDTFRCPGDQAVRGSPLKKSSDKGVFRES